MEYTRNINFGMCALQLTIAPFVYTDTLHSDIYKIGDWVIQSKNCVFTYIFGVCMVWYIVRKAVI